MAIFDRKLLKKVIAATTPAHDDKSRVRNDVTAFYYVTAKQEEGLLDKNESAVLSYGGGDYKIDITLPARNVSDLDDQFIYIPDLKKMVTKLPAKVAEVELTPVGSDIVIKGGKTSYNSCHVGEVDSLGFKEIEFSNSASFTISHAPFYEALNRVEHAQGKEETRPQLRGVCLHPVAKDKLNVIATDGHRASLSSVAISNLENLDSPVLQDVTTDHSAITIPTSLVSVLRALDKNLGKELGLASHDIKVTYFNAGGTKSGFIIEGNNFKVTGAGCYGAFPEYYRVFPETYYSTFEADKKEFADAIGMVDSMDDEKQPVARIIFNDNNMKVTGTQGNRVSTEIDDVKTEFTTDDHDINVGVRCKYVQAAINVLGNDRIKVGVGGKDVPVVSFLEKSKLSDNVEIIMQNTTE